jgi:hypothetical protein
MSTTIEAANRALVAADRCDRCGAQAYVRVTMPFGALGTGELLFCAHHIKEHGDKLKEKALYIHDERAALQST